MLIDFELFKWIWAIKQSKYTTIPFNKTPHYALSCIGGIRPSNLVLSSKNISSNDKVLNVSWHGSRTQEASQIASPPGKFPPLLRDHSQSSQAAWLLPAYSCHLCFSYRTNLYKSFHRGINCTS